MAAFDKQSYWHARFAHEDAFEWLVSSAAFVQILEPYLARLPASAAILHLGSGTSDLHCHLRARGFAHVTNVDYEPLALARGQALERQRFGDVRMQYCVADATRLADALLEQPRPDLQLPPPPPPPPPPAPHFDLVLDKSTADAVSCGGGDGLLRMADGVRACLADGGVWISLSYSAARFDAPLLPLAVRVVAKVPTPKSRPTDPDIYHWCYELRPAGQQPASE